MARKKKEENKDERIKWNLSDDSISNRKRLNELATQYKPLVVKIASQMYRKLADNAYWDDILSMANEGLVLAMRDYDPKKSTMKFTQYAAYAIRNNILNCMGTDLHVVTLNSYAISKMKENGESTFTDIRLSSITGETGGEDSYSREGKYGIFEEDTNAGEGHPIHQLINFIQTTFNKQDQELFFRIYGLNGYEECTSAQIAKERNVTCGAISQRKKYIIDTIKDNPEIVESLSILL